MGLAAPPAEAATYCRGLRATLVGTDGEDRLNGTGGRDVIAGLGGHDIVHAGPGDDVICLGPNKGSSRYIERGYGDKGNDVVSGGPGSEILYGGHGDDHLEVDGGRRNWAVGGPGNDELVGGPGDDGLGGARDDGGGGGPLYDYEQAFGEPGDDRMTGGRGDDRFFNGPGDSAFDGGAGTDRLVYYAKGSRSYSADLESGRARGAGRDSIDGVENLHAWTGGDIVLRGDDRPNDLLGMPLAREGTGQFYGEGADDLIVAHSATIRRSDYSFYGGHGNDVLVDACDTKDEGVDELFAGPGADEIVLGCGLKNASAGPGDDTLLGSEGFREDEVTYDGGPGFDLLAFEYASGGIEADLAAGTLTMSFEDGSTGKTHTLVELEALEGSDYHADTLLGDDGPNLLLGGVSEFDQVLDGDRIEGRGGDDEISGGDGNDELDGGDGEDKIDGGEGVDSCHAGESVNGCEVT